jgi:RNA polymerase subunit RPABC4/transcription elongation factor Spt4
MNKFYCDVCKEYTEHENDICSICGAEYDHNKRRVIICGPPDNEEVIKARDKILADDPDVIIIDEEIALKHRMDFSSATKYINPSPPDFFMPEINDLYEGVPKKLRGKRVDPVRDSKTDPKIGRNELCPCGSGLKYKKCCLTSNK